MGASLRSLTFVASALLGTAIGTFVGLIVAPDSGSATRKDIKRIVGEWSAQLPFTIDDLKNRRFRKRRDSSFVQLFRNSGG